ncbi:hypothetical protein RND71_038177 [Anisodus tanguticus]|uniref:Uncharacterized protein n=1 Tax=Anisodus tanguticus TaxID=243964 RepID=A0AAE1QZZ2_9SOLA|nr:hypothetical protein RND71_038177 [Anisodus tanguticus]
MQLKQFSRSSSLGSSSKRSTYSRNFDLPEDEATETTLDTGGEYVGGAMLPIFLNDLRRNNLDDQDLVEVTLELDDNSIVLCSVAPTPSHNAEGSIVSEEEEEVPNGFLTRSASAASKLRRKFSWIRSPSMRSRTTSAAPSEVSDDHFQHHNNISHTNTINMLSAREEMKSKLKLVRSKSTAQRALGGLRFISKTTTESDTTVLWKKVEAQFHALAKDGLLAREDFGECIGMVDSKEFAVGVFDALVRRRLQKTAKITKPELHEFWLQISDQSFDARLQIFFDMADSNGDGKITRDEVQELIMLSASANKLSKLKERAAEYASLIMEELDPECLGYIELWQLETLLLQRDNYMNYSRPLSTTSVGWGQNLGTRSKTKKLVKKASYAIKCLVLDNWQRGWILLLWVVIMAGLFTWKFLQYRRRAAFQVMGYCLATAKGAAETLKLNMALVLLPVCRNILTWLRSTRAKLLVPFDDNINFHKIIAYAMAVGILLHAGNHLVCDFPRLINSSPEKFALIASDFDNVKPTFKSLLTGIEGVTGIAMASMHFDMDVHLHAVAPLCSREDSENMPIRTLRSKNFEGDVFSLTMSKPNSFKYKSGQYLFLQCPTISSFEWHPFSITSSPGDDCLSVHIRMVGDWTNELKRVFTEDDSSACETGRAKFREHGNVDQRGLPRLLVDGPYGAAAQDYQNYDVLLLVGLGIGATPFISILKDLLNNSRSEELDSNTETSASDDSWTSLASSSVASTGKKKSLRTKSAHFYWVTREPGSFEWFKGVMNEVAEMDHKGLIEMHNYLTSVYEEGDARSTLITMVQALNHAKHGVDILSGTRVRTHFARPKWKEVFNKIASKHPYSTVGVFYCGLPALAKELKKLSQELTYKTSTRFEFHKEYF